MMVYYIAYSAHAYYTFESSDETKTSVATTAEHGWEMKLGLQYT